MRNLVENISDSYETRTSGIATLRGQVTENIVAARVHIGELGKSRQDTSRRLRAQLGKRHATRTKAEARRKSEAGSWLSETAKARHIQAEVVREDLAKEHSSRAAAESQRRSTSQSFLQDVAGRRQDMAGSLKASLDKVHSERAQSEAQRQSETDAILVDIRSSRQKKGEQLRSSLGKGRSVLAEAARQQRSRVQSWLKAVTAKQAEDHAAWQDMSSNLKSKRSNIAKQPHESAGESHAQGDMAALSDRVFERVASQPGGTRLTEMEQEFGISRFQIDKALKSLIERGKVEKRDRLYLAI